MASLKKRLSCNTPGEFFVDRSCIDCSVCREIAPSLFGDGRESACVVKQPESEEEELLAFQALVSCPVSAIGTVSKRPPPQVFERFPILIEDDVYLCGYASKGSYGALSYFIKHAEGNWLVDSPRFSPQLVKRLWDMGGLSYILLTHEDDVGDCDRYAEEFGAKRIIHRYDSRAVPKAEILLQSFEPFPFGRDFLVIPTPGHTKGHVVLLYKEKFLFTGDHLSWSRRRNGLVAYKDYCWYSWNELKSSMEKLLDYPFEWILPGHGYRRKVSRREFEEFVRQLLSS
ncbi:glyoxylase-like metal-dependent hydrolase (beta-lactamase superfamily II) [Hydrogenivirga caldilitoris]|uniref:Glyoxylase-like metal-dependent hydrolase (Beta-lactamase superfamily II) n=1 Tax=Hydrogenivirga caldilitoris TaxID=246264 RepID=A0A497XTX3_9AQUI|nr:MBL fold metallo-hydrolase [Hydrogenivirga caldilitoris]RLJ70373.1 glyoxylase-like metal-dependent hydrolase (beta-lactamase superfamily II) [Hydrogenivirga caldilitoris]